MTTQFEPDHGYKGSCLQIKLIRITLLHHTFIYNIFCLNDIECPEVWNIFHSQLVSFTFSVVSTSLIHFLWDKIVEIFLTKWKCITVNYFSLLSCIVDHSVRMLSARCLTDHWSMLCVTLVSHCPDSHRNSSVTMILTISCSPGTRQQLPTLNSLIKMIKYLDQL